MMMPIFLLLIGLFFLIKSSEISIDKSIRLSNLLGLSRMAVGFIFIATITSLPELSIAVISSLEGEGIISISNLFGSNIALLTIVFGLLSFLGFRFGAKDFTQLFQSVIITSIIAFFALVLGEIESGFGIFCLLIFLEFVYLISKQKPEMKIREEEKGIESLEIIKNFLILLGMLTIVVVSAKIVTDSSVEIATLLGISKSLLGVSIIALGTSLPELSIGFMAIKKGSISLAIGDVAGSLIINLTLVLGVTGILGTVVLSFTDKIYIISLLLINIIFLILTSKMRMKRLDGVILTFIYFIFLSALYFQI